MDSSQMDVDRQKKISTLKELEDKLWKGEQRLVGIFVICSLYTIIIFFFVPINSAHKSYMRTFWEMLRSGDDWLVTLLTLIPLALFAIATYFGGVYIERFKKKPLIISVILFMLTIGCFIILFLPALKDDIGRYPIKKFSLQLIIFSVFLNLLSLVVCFTIKKYFLSDWLEIHKTIETLENKEENTNA